MADTPPEVPIVLGQHYTIENRENGRMVQCKTCGVKTFVPTGQLGSAETAAQLMDHVRRCQAREIQGDRLQPPCFKHPDLTPLGNFLCNENTKLRYRHTRVDRSGWTYEYRIDDELVLVVIERRGDRWAWDIYLPIRQGDEPAVVLNALADVLSDRRVERKAAEQKGGSDVETNEEA